MEPQNMKAYQAILRPDQIKKIQDVAHELRISQNEIIRRAIDMCLETVKK